MAKIKIEDLPEVYELNVDELNAASGGVTMSLTLQTNQQLNSLQMSSMQNLLAVRSPTRLLTINTLGGLLGVRG